MNNLIAIYRLAHNGQWEFVAALSKEYFPKELPFVNLGNNDTLCELVDSIKRGIVLELDTYRIVEVEAPFFLLDTLCQPHSVIGT